MQNIEQRFSGSDAACGVAIGTAEGSAAPEKPAIALPPLWQFWLARVAKRSAERFPGSQSKPLVRAAKCMVRRRESRKLQWLCIPQRSPEATPKPLIGLD